METTFRFQAIVHGLDHEAIGPLPITFEQSLATLARLPRMFVEPDGSFVWAGEAADNVNWQVDGNLIDQGERLAYVEIKGVCPQEQFDALLTALGWPQAQLAFQLPRRGIFLDEAAFRRLAASEPGAI